MKGRGPKLGVRIRVFAAAWCEDGVADTFLATPWTLVEVSRAIIWAARCEEKGRVLLELLRPSLRCAYRDAILACACIGRDAAGGMGGRCKSSIAQTLSTMRRIHDAGQAVLRLQPTSKY